MASIVLLGASGFTGPLVAGELAADGRSFRAAGRDPARVRRALEHLPDGAVEAVLPLDVTDTTALERLLEDADLVVSTVGPFDVYGRPVLEAAVRTGTHYVDVAAEQPFLRWALERDGAARDAGVTAVAGAGFEFVPGDVLAHLAATAVDAPRDVHVSYTVRLPGSPLAGLSAGTRRTLATLLGRHGVALQHGELVEELPGEVRRLAWFPRPVGPSHAAGIPGAEPLTVPRHVPDVSTVRTYLAVPSWQAELLQLGANATRWSPARRLAASVLDAGRDGPDDRRRAVTRWACVAEAAATRDVAAAGEGVTRAETIARAWAYGTDIYRFSAVAVAVVAGTILAGEAPAGVVPPALVGEPTALLDRLAARTDLRWSVARPTSAS